MRMRGMRILRRNAAIVCSLLLGTFAPVASAQEEIKSGRPRIVGGEHADIKDHPWQVALNVKEGDKYYLCGGSLVAAKWVLTAAHCFKPTDQSSGTRVKAGATNYQTEGIWSSVDKIIIHEAYNTLTGDNDLALLKLKSAPTGKIIPMADSTLTVPVGEPLEVTGWGDTSEGGEGSHDLLKATVPYVDNATCNAPESYGGYIHAGMMCAGHREGHVDACQGDSGGPLVWRTSDGPVLVGVVSSGKGCARKLQYGVYTRVSTYRDWIKRTIAENPD
jgi:secreted trypsin-like serine protease